MSADVVDLPTELTQFARQREEDMRELEELREWKRQADRPQIELIHELVEAHHQLAQVDDFIDCVQARLRAGWLKVPRRDFERLVEMRKG